MTVDDSIIKMLLKTVIEGDLSQLAKKWSAAADTPETADTTETIEAIEPGDLVRIIQAKTISSKMSTEQDEANPNRYVFEERLLSHNDDIILNLTDVNLNRSIEARLVSGTNGEEKHAETLVHEAHMLSRLDHPGIPPIYDLDVSDEKQIYYTMKRIAGLSLSVLTSSDIDEAHKRHANIHEIVGVFIKVADVIAYAHSHQVIHRDIKPDNIVVGDFGAVYIVDWKTAINETSNDAGGLCGTPLYMSPEQVKEAGVDKRSDIYSFGASLFHILLKRPPIFRGELDDFWEAKKAGVIDAYDKHTDEHVPAPLLAICMRCLTVDPADRYQDIDEVITDLKKYQNGQIVDVYQYGVGDLIVHWIKNNAMHLTWAVLFLIVVGIAGYYAYQFNQRQLGEWGDPIYEENFEKGDAWKDQWYHEFRGTKLVTENGALITKNGPEFIWFYKKPLDGSVAIEFEGTIVDGAVPGDLSVVYCADIDEYIHEGKRPLEVYYLQHAAIGNACSMIEGPNGRLDYVPQKLEVGTTYKIRGEIDGKMLSLFLDGEKVCSYEMLVPQSYGYIGLYAYYDNKSIDNIKIYNRELPEITNIIETGDVLFENNLFELAQERYEKIYQSYEGTELGTECLYKIGLCQFRLKDWDEAFKVWNSIGESKFDVHIKARRWEIMMDNDEHEQVIDDIAATCQNLDPSLRVQVREQWGRYLSFVRQMGFIDLTRKYLDVRETYFPDDRIFVKEVYYSMELLEELDKFPQMFPDNEPWVVRALFEMARYDELLEKYSHRRNVVPDVYLKTGQYQRILDEFPNRKHHCFEAMMALGLFDEIAKIFNSDGGQSVRVRLARGEIDQVAQEYRGNLDVERTLMIHRNEAKKYLDTFITEGEERHQYVLNSVIGTDIKSCLLLDRYELGDKNAIEYLEKDLEQMTYFNKARHSQSFQTRLLTGVWRHYEGDPKPLQQTLQKIWQEKKPMMQMRLWYNVGLVMGKLDKTGYMAQPYQEFIQHQYLLYAALHQDLYGDKQEAYRLYKECQAVPRHLTDNVMFIRKFVDYRLKRLAQ